jgi:hypothetical protein
MRQKLISGYNRRLARPLGLRAAARQAAPSAAGETSVLVFSKDRPMQLHALLASVSARLTGVHALTVLYAASDRHYLNAYLEVEERHAGPQVEFLPQAQFASFRSALREMLASVHTATLAFLVDDIICLRPCDISELAALADHQTVPSLRLGRNCLFSYTQDRAVNLPASLSPLNHSLWQWRYGDGDAHWGYPLSVDGHVFLTTEFRALAGPLLYGAPNSFENALQVYRQDFAGRRGICYEQSRVVSLPYNQVQGEVENLHGSLDAQWFLQQWTQGRELDWQAMAEHDVHGVHQELPLVLRNRPG